jgi:hypothetical protein
MTYKPGDRVRLSGKYQDYLAKYSGTYATIVSHVAQGLYNVKGYDNYEFSCPESYFEDDDFFGTWTVKKCECGAESTYGPNCPTFYHAFYCPKYSPPRKTDNARIK